MHRKEGRVGPVGGILLCYRIKCENIYRERERVIPDSVWLSLSRTVPKSATSKNELKPASLKYKIEKNWINNSYRVNMGRHKWFAIDLLPVRLYDRAWCDRFATFYGWQNRFCLSCIPKIVVVYAFLFNNLNRFFGEKQTPNIIISYIRPNDTHFVAEECVRQTHEHTHTPH